MKKILIPIFGLLVLILLTPVILSKLANSNIDKKIEKLKNNGIQIEEISKNITYLDSNRKFKILLSSDSNNSTWKKYHQFLKNANFIVDLKFRNLPVTKADMQVLATLDFGNFKLQDIKLHIITKNFKDFEYQLLSIKDFIIEDFNGTIHKKKYLKLQTTTKVFNYPEFFYSKENYIDGEIKDILLGLANLNWHGKEWKIKYDKFVLSGLNSEENLTTHLLGTGKYLLEDRFFTKSLRLDIYDFKIVLKNFNWNLKLNKDKTTDVVINMNWNKSKYQNAIVSGGKIEIRITNIESYKDFNLDANIKLDNSLFKRISKDLNPKFVNKYLTNGTSNIKIKNGEIKINGNRIQ